MWTESLPAFAIITGAVAGTGFLLHGIHNLFHDESRRYHLNPWSRTMMKRDALITGSAYKQRANLDPSTDGSA